ncbi:MAG: hypothetical protein B6U95_07740 [Thermofilum sp. ex4484_82]|nr:MAG: hypothetical protein B6U95_07740 [Thermofilum sp. ex4484_82]OYT36945.1 MAG: hypothetical protein B6U96_07740 [Archaeoglobales archaeon ex4484_92]
MVRRERIREIIEYGIKTALDLGAYQVEGFGYTGKETRIYVRKRQVSSSVNLISGIAFRIATRNNVGFSYTTSLSEKAVKCAVENAFSNAKAKGEDKSFKSLPEPIKTAELKTGFDEAISSLTIKDLIEFYEKAKDIVERNKSLIMVAGLLSAAHANMYVINSLGLDHQEEKTILIAYTYAGYLKELPPATGGWDIVVNKLTEFDPDFLGEKTAEDAKRAIGAKNIEFSGESSVIFEPAAINTLFFIFAREIAANNVDRGATPFGLDKINLKVANKNLFIIDNARYRKNAFISSRDHEGVPTRENVIIDKGILKKHLTDYYFALKWGVEPTGNAWRTSGSSLANILSNEPTISPSFLMIKGNEERSLEDLISGVDHGFLVRDVMGVHMSDFSSGKFSVPVFGWLIENGEVKHPVRNLMISGTMPSVLENCIGVSKEKEIHYFPLPGEYPYLLVEFMTATASKQPLKFRLIMKLLNLMIKLGLYRNPIAY